MIGFFCAQFVVCLPCQKYDDAYIDLFRSLLVESLLCDLIVFIAWILFII